MNYKQYSALELEAWSAFADVMEKAGIDRYQLMTALDKKYYCLTDVTEAILDLVELEE